jgi:uncharacterized repeat protein (TIGR01451 family)/uncharacterized repeat protein (TIGR02543 family)
LGRVDIFHQSSYDVFKRQKGDRIGRNKLAAIIVACIIAIIAAIVLLKFEPWKGTRPAEIYTLTTNTSPPGAGSISISGGEYESGDQVTLTANPASGYAFDHWSGDASGTTPTITITMDSNKSLTANFKPVTQTYNLTIDITPSGAGSVSRSGGEYASGVQVILTANPASGYTFDRWSGDASGTTSSITITMDSDKSLTANFKVTTIMYALTIEISPSGAGSVSITGGAYESGVEATLTASPATGYHFVNWTGDIGTIADVNDATTTITMNNDYAVTANFASLPSITVTSPNGGENWNTGSIQTITWTSSGITGGVCIDISWDGGSSWSDIITNTANDDSQSWTVAGPATTQARIRVRSTSDGSIWDMSNDNFIIGLLSPDFSVNTDNYKEVSKMFAVVGDVLTFTIHYGNTGNMDATGVVITDVVDTNLRDVAPQDGGSYDAETRAITWNIGAVAEDAGGTVHFTAVVPPLCNDTTVYNSATIDSDQTAPEDTPTKMIWVMIDVWIALTSDVSPDPTTVDQATNFIATVSGSAPSYSWSWTVDGTEVATTQNASYTFTSAGVYDVCVTVTDCGGNANAHSCHHVTVNPPS